MEIPACGPCGPQIPAAATVGTFDGVHCGHLAVLEKLKEITSLQGLRPLAVTFARHPLATIAPERAPLAISTAEGKARLLEKAGVTPVMLDFDETLRNTSARDWMRRLRDTMGVKAIILGHDNKFGCDGRSLEFSDYEAIAREEGIALYGAPAVDGISSSAIRKAIAAGEIGNAAGMLGRPFTLTGTVAAGQQLGRTIGFPTANITTPGGIIIPRHGAYAAWAQLPAGIYPAMVNVGTRPTVAASPAVSIEANIIGWEGDLYGRDVTLAFVSRLRNEQQFPSIDALRSQLERDRRDTLRILEKSGKPQSTES